MKRRAFLSGLLASGAGLATASALGHKLLLGRAFAAEGRFTDYRALVAIYLGGGNDSLNMLLPADARYAAYAAARQTMAWAEGSGHPITPLSATPHALAFAPPLPSSSALFARRELSLVANVGVLTAPVTKAELRADRALQPPRLFSHNDQQYHWFRGSTDTRDLTGWAGRAADLLIDADPDALLPMNLSLQGANQWQTGAMTTAYGLGADGATPLYLLGHDADVPLRTDTFQRLLSLAASPLERQYAATFERARDFTAIVQSTVAAIPDGATPVPADNPLAQQLSVVSKLIAARDTLGQRRQIFAAVLGGWDSHDAQLTDHPRNLGRLDAALGWFRDRLVELGVFGEVTTFTASEFGRTLTTNGDGTDHGWGGHQLVMGGAIAGGDILGTLPALEIGSDDDLDDGRIIPTLAVEQLGAALLGWFGLSAGELAAVFPYLDRFAGPLDLFT